MKIITQAKKFVCRIVLGLLLGSVSDSYAQQALWELRPYQVRVLVAADDGPQFRNGALQRVVDRLPDLLVSSVGEGWQTRVEEAEPATQSVLRRAMRESSVDDVSIGDVTKDLDLHGRHFDKVFLIYLSGAHEPGVMAWEWDRATMTWSRGVHYGRRRIRDSSLLATKAILKVFRPLSIVEGAESNKIQLRGRASEISFAQPRIQPSALNATLQLCQANAGLLEQGPLADVFLIVDGRTDSYSTCRVFGNQSFETIADSLKSGRWLALEISPRFEKSRIELTGSLSWGPHFTVRLRRSLDNQLTWQGAFDRRGVCEIPNEEVRSDRQPLTFLMEVAVADFVVAAEPVALGSRRRRQVEPPLTTKDVQRLIDAARCRDLITESATRQAIFAQRIQTRTAAGDKESAAELLKTAQQSEEQAKKQINSRLESLRAGLGEQSPIVRQHVKSLEDLIDD